MTGWIKLHRQLLDWEWYSKPVVKSVFVHSLLRANHKDGKWQGKEIKRGSFISSVDKLSGELGHSRQEVRTALKHLKSTNELTSVSSSQHTVFTVINYDNYQGATNEATNEQPTVNQPSTNEQPTANQPSTTNNKDNNNKNDKKALKPLSAKANPAFELFSYWCEVMGKSISTSKLTPKREKKIKDRLKQGYTFDQIKTAIFNCSQDAFSMNRPGGGNTRGKPFNDLELICRDGEKLESFLTASNAPTQLDINHVGTDFTTPPEGWNQ